MACSRGDTGQGQVRGRGGAGARGRGPGPRGVRRVFASALIFISSPGPRSSPDRAPDPDRRDGVEQSTRPPRPAGDRTRGGHHAYGTFRSQPACRLSGHPRSRAARRATVEVRAAIVTLRFAARGPDQELDGLRLYAVRVREVNAGERGLDWLLLTNTPVISVEHARAILDGYRGSRRVQCRGHAAALGPGRRRKSTT